jgi:hypothetical protein
LDSLWGKTARLRDRYQKTRISKRRSTVPIDPTTGDNVKIVLDDGRVLMLGIYYELDGSRSTKEVQQLHGKRVELVGRLYRRTPTQYTDSGQPLATMVGPYIGEIQSVTAIP